MNLFNNINEKNKKKLLRLLESNTLFIKKDTNILNTIKNNYSLCIIIDGFVQIIKIDYNGNKIIEEELYEDDIFGAFLLPLNNNEYEILAKENTKIIEIDYERIMNCRENNKSFYNEFIKNLLQIIIDKINKKNERIEILTKKTIRNKLLEYFKINAKKHGSKYVYLPFNFTDLADYLAVDRSAMSRELKYLKEEGFIEIKGKRITLLY